MTAVVALSAAQGTGKTELARAIAQALGGTYISVSGYLATMLAAEGLEPDAERLKHRGAKLAENPAELVERVLEYAGWKRGCALTFDAIRHADVLEQLRRRVHPLPVLHVGLVVPEDERTARLLGRGRPPLTSAAMTHSTEAQVPQLVESADLVLDGTRGIDQLVASVVGELAAR